MIVLWLSYAGNAPMMIAIFTGAILAYAAVKKRKPYPLGRILNGTIQQVSWNKGEIESFLGKIEFEKRYLGWIVFAWLTMLFLMWEFSLLWASGANHYFSGTNFITLGLRIPTILSLILPHIAKYHRADVLNHVGQFLSVIDGLILCLLSLFLSVTASWCLYWLYLYSRANRTGST